MADPVPQLLELGLEEELLPENCTSPLPSIWWLRRYPVSAVLGFCLCLKLSNITLVALVRDNGEDIDPLIVNALTLLIAGESDSAADLLPLLELGRRLVQRADLKDVWVVPALAQRGVRENERDRFVE